MTDYYALLGIRRTATDADLRKAFRRLARKYHPDINPGDRAAEMRYQRICEAYEVLSDPEERDRYDRLGTARSTETSETEARYGFEGFDFSLTGDLGADIFPEIFRRRKAVPDPPAEGREEDLQHSLSMSFEESLKGVTASFRITRMVCCPSCMGWGEVAADEPRTCESCQGRGRATQTRGHMLFAKPCSACGGSGVLDRGNCPDCHGLGRLPRQETIELRTPPGVYDGFRMVVVGKGNESRGGGKTGDLHVLVHVAPHPFFTRQGDHLLCTVPITFTEAALGCKVDVPTVDGPIKVRVPAGVESGQKLRISGRGAPSLIGGGRGDLFVIVHVVTPKVHDHRSKELLRELAELHPEDPRTDLWTGPRENQEVTR